MGFFQKLLGVGGDGGAGDTLSGIEAELRGIETPTVEDLTYRLDNLVQQGVITPEQAKDYLVEQTAFSDISEDPTLRDAQIGALSSLKDISESGGLTLTDRAKLEEITSRLGQEERGSREAIMQNAAERGRSGSGLEFAAMLENQQGAATRAAQEGTDLAALAEQRALESLTQGANLAGQVRGQDFDTSSRVAEAKDALAKFNAEHLQSTEASNVAARNAAQAQNLAEKQRVADTNVETAGKNREIQATAKQTAFENEMDKKKAIADALAAKAQIQQQRAAQKDAFTGSLLGTVGTVGTSLMASDEKLKDIEGKSPDMDEFMESLRPIAFSYKSGGVRKGESPGRQIGVLAQDVEKTPEGRTMVEDTPDGKMLNTRKGFGAILAALAELHDEIEDLKGRDA